MTSPWDEFDPSTGAGNVLHWAQANGATTLGEAYELLDQLAVSNDVPEVLGEEDTVDGVREELELGLELVGPDAPITGLT